MTSNAWGICAKTGEDVLPILGSRNKEMSGVALRLCRYRIGSLCCCVGRYGENEMGVADLALAFLMLLKHRAQRTGKEEEEGEEAGSKY